METLQKNFGKLLVYIWTGILFIAGITVIPLFIMFFGDIILNANNIKTFLIAAGAGVIVVALLITLGYVVLSLLLSIYKDLK